MARRLARISGRIMFALALSLIVVLGTSAGVRADEADAKRRLKAMSDYLVAQKALALKEFCAFLINLLESENEKNVSE